MTPMMTRFLLAGVAALVLVACDTSTPTSPTEEEDVEPHEDRDYFEEFEDPDPVDPDPPREETRLCRVVVADSESGWFEILGGQYYVPTMNIRFRCFGGNRGVRISWWARVWDEYGRRLDGQLRAADNWEVGDDRWVCHPPGRGGGCEFSGVRIRPGTRFQWGATYTVCGYHPCPHPSPPTRPGRVERDPNSPE